MKSQAESCPSCMGLLEEKLDILNDIYRNTTAQDKAIGERDEARLLVLLEERQRFMDRITIIEKKFAYEKEPGTDNREIQKMQNHIHKRLGEIIELDRSNARQCDNFKLELQKSIQHIRLGKKALADGYLKSRPQPTGFFVDKVAGRKGNR